MNEQDNKLQNPVNDKIIEQHSIHFSGPLPHPFILQEYDKIIPGAAERILKMAEEQSKHRKTLEVKVIESDINNSKLGLIFGLIIGLAGIGGSVVASIYGRQIISGILGVGTIGSLVGVFVYGSQQRKNEREDARKDK
ncbi:MAG: DUF2335 domain-containing protein [bacterium]